MISESDDTAFERIYATDLVYVPNCWKLCRDAHCCSFARYKSRFRIIKAQFQELPLLPGEYEFLKSKDWLKQFGDHDHKIVEFEIDGYCLKAESIVSRNKGCACEHDMRPTICRLYPLLPKFNISGKLIGTEPMSIYEHMEQIGELDPACALTNLPFDQMEKFISICFELSRNPKYLFYIMAYSAAKRHVSANLDKMFSSADKDIFSLFEIALIKRSLIEADVLRSTLSELAREFEKHYSGRFQIP